MNADTDRIMRQLRRAECDTSLTPAVIAGANRAVYRAAVLS
jgi:hypothetical protein